MGGEESSVTTGKAGVGRESEGGAPPSVPPSKSKSAMYVHRAGYFPQSVMPPSLTPPDLL